MLKTRDARWFLLGLAGAVLATVTYYLGYTMLLGYSGDLVNILGVFLFFLVVCQLAATAGFFGWKLLLTTSSLGLAVGLVVMLATLSQGAGGWEDLIAFLIMFQLIIAGFVLGGILQLIHWLVKRSRERQKV